MLLVLVPVWAPSPAHFACLELSRQTINDRWNVQYAEPLPQPARKNRQKAINIARTLGARSNTKQFAPTMCSGAQHDGWRC
eukprot:10246609-Karenia_brevis.AAC.1